MDLFRRMFSGKTDRYSPPIGGIGAVDSYMPGFRHAFASFSKEAAQLERLARYEKNWRAFFGISLDSPAKNVEKREKDTTARINYTQITLLRNMAFAFSQPWCLTLEYEPTTNGDGDTDPVLSTDEKRERAKMGEMVRFSNAVFNKDNPGDTVRLEGALHCGVAGDVFIVASPVLPESIAVKYLDNGQVEADLKDTQIRVQAINPMFCAPEWSTDGVSLSRLIVRYPVTFLANERLTGNKVLSGIFEQDITKDTVIERVYNSEQKLIETKELPNPVGMVYAVHIRNIVSPGKYGIDDVAAIRGMVEEINDKIVDVSNIIDYHSAPTTMIFGARAGSLEKGANKVWSGLPKDARVENLRLDGDMPAMNTFIENMRNMIKETTGVNSAALGEDLAISNTSGVALHMRFYSMAAIAELKWASWRPQVALLSKIILAWGKYLKQIEIPDGMMRKYSRALCVNFESNLPKDRLLTLQENKEAVAGGLRSLRKALSNMGSNDPEGDLQEIEDDLTKYPKLAALITGGKNADNAQVDTGLYCVPDNVNTTLFTPVAGVSNR